MLKAVRKACVVRTLCRNNDVCLTKRSWQRAYSNAHRTFDIHVDGKFGFQKTQLDCSGSLQATGASHITAKTKWKRESEKVRSENFVDPGPRAGPREAVVQVGSDWAAWSRLPYPGLKGITHFKKKKKKANTYCVVNKPYYGPFTSTVDATWPLK